MYKRQDQYSDVLEDLSEDVRNGIIRQMVPEILADALEDMDTDDLVETLSGLPEAVSQDALSSMDEQDRQRAEQALSYGEDTAGFIMNTDTITLVREPWTMPEQLPLADGTIVPLKAGETVNWRLA